MTQAKADELRALAVRVETFTGSDIAPLCLDIAVITGLFLLEKRDKDRAQWLYPSDANPAWVRRSIGFSSSFGLPRYVTRIDEALTLVPAGWNWMTGFREQDHARAYVENAKPHSVKLGGLDRNPELKWFETTAATPALALCAAALRARAEIEEK